MTKHKRNPLVKPMPLKGSILIWSPDAAAYGVNIHHRMRGPWEPYCVKYCISRGVAGFRAYRVSTIELTLCEAYSRVRRTLNLALEDMSIFWQDQTDLQKENLRKYHTCLWQDKMESLGINDSVISLLKAEVASLPNLVLPSKSLVLKFFTKDDA